MTHARKMFQSHGGQLRTDALCRGNELPPQPGQRKGQRPLKTKGLPANGGQARHDQGQHEPIAPLHLPRLENGGLGVSRRLEDIVQNDRSAKLQYRNEEKETCNDGKNPGARTALPGFCNLFLVRGCSHIKIIIFRNQNLRLRGTRLWTVHLAGILSPAPAIAIPHCALPGS